MDRIESHVSSAPEPEGQDSSERLLSRRNFVRRVGLAGATLAVAGPVLAACGTTNSSYKREQRQFLCETHGKPQEDRLQPARHERVHLDPADARRPAGMPGPRLRTAGKPR